MNGSSHKIMILDEACFVDVKALDKIFPGKIKMFFVKLFGKQIGNGYDYLIGKNYNCNIAKYKLNGKIYFTLRYLQSN